jgi:hypothetical protein
MDVHQATISVAVMDSAGKLILGSILETKEDTILQFISGLRVSQSEIGGDKPCSQQLSPKWPLRKQRVDCFRVTSHPKGTITGCDGHRRGVLRPSTDSAQCKMEQLWHFLC